MERTLKTLIPNEPEVMMRVTALLKRKGYRMVRILMEEATALTGAWLTITLAEDGPHFTGALNTVGKVVGVRSVEEVPTQTTALELQ